MQYMFKSSSVDIRYRPMFKIQGGPAKVRPTYIFDGNI